MTYEEQARAAIDRLYAAGNVKRVRSRYEMLYGSPNLITNVIRAIKREELDF